MMPKAIAASATDVPHLFQGESYSGWMMASPISATTAKTTTAAHPSAQRSQDDAAFSIAFSGAFIVPSRKYHANNESFLWGLLGGLLVGTMVFTVFLVVGLYLQWRL